MKQEIGGEVVDFSLPLISGGSRDLGSILEGKKGAVIVFWSDTCSHCVRYDPYLNSLASRHPELGFVAIASRHGETLESVRAAVQERGLVFPILHDQGGTVAAQWFTQQTPRAFLVDADRKLLYRGAIDNFKFAPDPEFQGYLEPAIAEFLTGKPVSRPETASFGCAIQSVYYILPKPLA
jgi:thiol-disulfide isomerase/thioredoxin